MTDTVHMQWRGSRVCGQGGDLQGPHLRGSSSSAGPTAQGSGGTQACTAGVKGLVLTSFSISSTCGERGGWVRGWVGDRRAGTVCVAGASGLGKTAAGRAEGRCFDSASLEQTLRPHSTRRAGCRNRPCCRAHLRLCLPVTNAAQRAHVVALRRSSQCGGFLRPQDSCESTQAQAAVESDGCSAGLLQIARAVAPPRCSKTSAALHPQPCLH